MEESQPSPEWSDESATLESALEEKSASLTNAPGKTPLVPHAQDRLRRIQDSTLNFLATASNETLGACAVGLCASTYLVLGRVGLVLIGTVGGIVLHATWEGSSKDQGSGGGLDTTRRRKELGIEVARQVLDWRDSKHRAEEKEQATDNVSETLSKKDLDFSDFQPEVSEALTSFTHAVIRDYVKWWYTPILPKEQSFPSACRQTLTSFIISFSNHLSHKRTADTFLDFVANSTSIIIVFLNELATALKASQRQDAAEAIRTYLQYQPDSSLANVLSTEQQDRKLSLVADDILQSFLDSKALEFPPSKSFLSQVLSGLILDGVVTTCSKPEWINGWIVYLLEDGEPELMNAIDAGVEDMNARIGDAQEMDMKTSKLNSKHSRRVSRAEEAMQEAMREAQRLNEMIAADDARRKRTTGSGEVEDTASTATTEGGMATPTSSDSGRNRQGDRSMESSMVFDSEGNAMPSIASTPSKETPIFTSFDQLGNSIPTALQPSIPTEAIVSVQLTLHNAIITILDMGDGNERSAMKQRPTTEYLLQIEPASSRFPGWMISRKYPDLEALHETIRKIAIISGVPEFAQQHATLPSWKGQTRGSFIQSLEVYLKDALKHEPLAESESMKKFLEKETGLSKAPAQGKNVLVQSSAALENVGKGFISVLGQGGKGIAGGGKAVLGGVQGVFGAVATGVGGPKKATPSPRVGQSPSRVNLPTTSSTISSDHDSPKRSIETNYSENPPALPSRPYRMSSDQGRPSQTSSRDRSHTELSQGNLSLPPPPSEMSDDYSPMIPGTPEVSSQTHLPQSASPRPPTPSSMLPVNEQESPLAYKSPKKAMKSRWQDAPITEEETRVSVELIFAIITELYGLSSAWTIRLSLLSAAKTFLLRPNNPQLESIRLLIQDSVIDANFSDSGLATHVNKLRENTLPTDEERAKWPKDLTPVEKENLRIKARKLLVERGMPQALTSVMGAAASGEALARVFDCLQVEEVARGLIFALLLQAIRAVTQ